MKVRRATATAIAAALVVAVAVVVALSDDGAGGDVARVYCLAPDRRDGLVDAAVALDLAQRSGRQLRVAGMTMDTRTWLANRPEDFERACAAFFAAEKAPRPSTFATAMPFLTGATSAILAFIATLSLTRVTRGRERAERLRSAFEELRRAVEAYIEGFEKTGLRAKLLECRGTLVAQLAIIQSAHPTWRRVNAAIDELTVGPFAQTIARRTPGNEDLTALLMTVRSAVFAVAHALEQPLIPHRRMREAS